MEQAVLVKLESWLGKHVPGFSGPFTMCPFSFGQSNPTFRLSASSGEYVLRRKPLGPLLPKAHAIEREFRVIRALAASEVPVPRTYGFCEDDSILGSPFYVMEYMDGRIFYDQRMPELAADERFAIFDAMNSAVAKLHSVEPLELDLAGYGNSEHFLSRQVVLWTKQYRASEGLLIKPMEALIEWLPRHVPEEEPARIFHGDLRLDNMVFHRSEPRVIALLDWELSTLGNAIADFAYHMIVWRIGPTLFRGYAGLDFAALGIPTEDEYVRSYAHRTQRLAIPHWHFYLGFGLFRLAAILQGVWWRAQNGSAVGHDAVSLGERVAPLAALGWDIVQHG